MFANMPENYDAKEVHTMDANSLPNIVHQIANFIYLFLFFFKQNLASFLSFPGVKEVNSVDWGCGG